MSELNNEVPKKGDKVESKVRLPACCCLLLNAEYTYDGQNYSILNLLLEPQFDDNGNCFYEIEAALPSTAVPAILSWGTVVKEDVGWTLSFNGEDVYFFGSDYVCPLSSTSDWAQISPTSPIDLDSVYISPIDCTEPDIDIPDLDIPDPNCNEPFSCKFVNLLKKQRASLAVDVAGNSNYEVFGLKGCEENWNNLFMRSLIIDALECVPQAVYSEATENCLINKLTETCNC